MKTQHSRAHCQFMSHLTIMMRLSLLPAFILTGCAATTPHMIPTPVAYNATQGTGYEFRGYFGVEAFVIDNLSIGGNVGVGYVKEGETTYEDASDPTISFKIDGDTEYATSSSAIQATIYW